MKSIFTKNSVNKAFYYWILRACLATVLIFPTITSLNAAPLTSWDKKINNAAQRFKVLPELGGVLDNETQLIWEQLPEYNYDKWDWASRHCNQLKLGNRFGWRLPTLDVSSPTNFPDSPLLVPPPAWNMDFDANEFRNQPPDAENRMSGGVGEVTGAIAYNTKSAATKLLTPITMMEKSAVLSASLLP
jgi:hypothetical protein